ncbi:hypothetical protein KAH55_14660, partial [bacterium]|nr:hypothetical protein [bacterium]
MKKRLVFFLILFVVPALFAQQSLKPFLPVSQDGLPEFPDSKTAYRVNVGGDLFIDSSDREWLADRLYHDGSGYGYVGVSHVYDYDGTIENTSTPLLYQHSRYGLSGYYFDVPNGYYEVILHFSENYFGKAGHRQMKIRIEHKAIAAKFDILAHTRRSTALRLKYDLQKMKLPVLDGRLEIELFALQDETKLSAIEIRPLHLDAVLFKIDTHRLHFTTETDSLGVLIRNLGNRPAYWQADVAALPIWLDLPETEGWLQPKEIYRITSKINRKIMTPGMHESVLKLTGNAFSEEIPLTAAVSGKSELSSVTTELIFSESELMLPLHIKNTGGRPTA